MKALLFISTLCLGLAACNTANDSDYEAIASDLCDCFNESTVGLSDETKNALVAADKNGGDILTAVTDHFMENPDLAVSDGAIITKAGEELESTCLVELETKYDNVYSTENEQEIQKKLLEALAKKKGCEFTHSIMSLGLQMQNAGGL